MQLFFTNKVAHQLFRRGYTTHTIPPANLFGPICNGLKRNGYDPDRAAELWHRCMIEDTEAQKEMYKNSGVQGQLLLYPVMKQLNLLEG